MNHVSLGSSGPGGVQILRHLLTTSGNQLPHLQTGLTNAPTSQGCEDGRPSMPHVVAPRVMGIIPSSPQNLSPEPGLGSRRVQGCGGLLDVGTCGEALERAHSLAFASPGLFMHSDGLR